MIARLEGHAAQFDTAMLYVSDHGESLGEYGLYLHGTPWFVAPGAQTHVPMLLWTSSSCARDFHLDTACLRGRQAEKLSHDNLFHSMLGLLDIETVSHDKELDLFAGCG